MVHQTRVPMCFDVLTDSGLHSVGLDYKQLTTFPVFPFEAIDLQPYYEGIQESLCWTLEELCNVRKPNSFTGTATPLEVI